MVTIDMTATKTGAVSHLCGIVKGGDTLIGLYEVSDDKGGVLFKRVCDHPVRELLRLQILPVDSAAWPTKYEPFGTYGGSRKLPSRASAADLMAD